MAYCKVIAIGDLMDVCTYNVLFYCTCYCLVKPSENCLIVCICDYACNDQPCNNCIKVLNFGLCSIIRNLSVCTNGTKFLPLMQNLMESLLKFIESRYSIDIHLNIATLVQFALKWLIFMSNHTLIL